MEVKETPFTELLSKIVDNRGRTCPTAETGIPLIATNCIRNDLLYPAFEKVRYVSKSTYDTWFRGHPAPGDLVFVCKGTPGRVCMTPDPVSFCIAQDMVAVRADPKKVYPKYLFALLRSSQVQEKISNMHVGTLIPHFKKGDFDKLLLPIPDKKTQEAIGDAYFELSAKIELNRRMNATLEAMARALFQSWFVDFDPVRAKLDGREPVGLDLDTSALFPEYLEDSLLGAIPKGWQVQRIREVVEKVFDGPHATPPNAEEGPVFLGIKNLTGSSLDLSDTRHISESDWHRWTKRATPRPLDIVFSYEATLGFFALIPPGLRCCLGRRLALIRPRAEDGHSHFWFHQFIGPDFQRYLIQHSVQGATVDRIPLIQFPNYLVLNPPSALKEAFECRVAPLWAKIHSNAKQSRTLATLRDTLLPKLLSGALSVAGNAWLSEQAFANL
jgi:type I restriction enzyme S subunit